jgi:hypothetical protein
MASLNRFSRIAGIAALAATFGAAALEARTGKATRRWSKAVPLNSTKIGTPLWHLPKKR